MGLGSQWNWRYISDTKSLVLVVAVFLLFLPFFRFSIHVRGIYYVEKLNAEKILLQQVFSSLCSLAWPRPLMTKGGRTTFKNLRRSLATFQRHGKLMEKFLSGSSKIAKVTTQKATKLQQRQIPY